MVVYKRLNSVFGSLSIIEIKERHCSYTDERSSVIEEGGGCRQMNGIFKIRLVSIETEEGVGIVREKRCL